MNTKHNIALGIVFLLGLSILHFFAYSLHESQGESKSLLDAKLALLFILYYLSWIAVLVAVFLLMNIYTPRYGTQFLILLFVATTVIWVPCATIIDGFLADRIYQMTSRSMSEIIATSKPLDYYNKFLTYCFLFGATAVIVYYRLYQNARIQVLEQQRASAEAKFDMVDQRLTSLQSQLAPHFLFNCLNMLSALARTGQSEKLVFVIARLGDMLRFVSEASRRSTIPLGEELEFVETYIQLQEVRFGNKYHFSMDVNGDSGNIECPPFCLHTLVENAYTHSTPTAERNTDIRVQITTDDQAINLQVTNNNSGSINAMKLGIGLVNLEKRLALLYGDSYELSSEAASGSYTATMSIPR